VHPIRATLLVSFGLFDGMDGLTASEEAMIVKIEAQLDTGASVGTESKPVACRSFIREQVRCERSQIAAVDHRSAKAGGA
jgi:hypothetical protein